MAVVDSAWLLYRDAPDRRSDAVAIAQGVAIDPDAAPVDVARAGILLVAAGRYAAASAACSRAVADGAPPAQLLFLEPVLLLSEGDALGARRSFARLLAAAEPPVHRDVAWVAECLGAPRLAYRAAERAGLGRGARLASFGRALQRRAPRKTCAACSVAH